MIDDNEVRLRVQAVTGHDIRRRLPRSVRTRSISDPNRSELMNTDRRVNQSAESCWVRHATQLMTESGEDGILLRPAHQSPTDDSACLLQSKVPSAPLAGIFSASDLQATGWRLFSPTEPDTAEGRPNVVVLHVAGEDLTQGPLRSTKLPYGEGDE